MGRRKKDSGGYGYFNKEVLTDEKGRKTGVKIIKEDMTTYVKENAYGKSRRYASDIKNKTNTVSGNDLTVVEKSYRMGYLKARRDNADAYLYNKYKDMPDDNQEKIAYIAKMKERKAKEKAYYREKKKKENSKVKKGRKNG